MIIPPEASAANDLTIQTEAQKYGGENNQRRGFRNNDPPVALGLWHRGKR
jgi:hypothetical protein